MFTYIPRNLKPNSNKHWEELIDESVGQILEYPDSKRPYCDLTHIILNSENTTSQKVDEDGEMRLGFKNFDLDLTYDLRFNKKSYEIKIKQYTENNINTIIIQGDIIQDDKIINYRSINIEEFEKEPVKIVYPEKVYINQIHSIPTSLETNLERF